MGPAPWAFGRGPGRPRQPRDRPQNLDVRAAFLGPDGSWDPWPLSDEERRRLDEIERSLQPEGNGSRAGLGRRVGILFARADEIDDPRQRRRVAACAVMGMGLVVLLTGLMLTQGSAAVGLMVAVVGVVIMAGAAALFLRHGRHR